MGHRAGHADSRAALDFGIVKARTAAGDLDTASRTQEHFIQGSPAFIAPEQALGGSRLDGRTDIYATGCMAYWLLTGQLVFTAETAMALIAQHAQAEPAAPSTRTARSIPAVLDALVLSCLAKEPGRRPQSAKELSRRLEEIELGSSWTQDRAHAWWLEHELAGPAPLAG